MNPNSLPDPAQKVPEPERKGLTRRQVILGSVGAAVGLGAGIPTTLALTAARRPTPASTASSAASPRTKGVTPGKLVKALLATHAFTVAHRGGSRDWPEMSMLGYRNSVAAGVNGLEMSLGRTSDGVWFGLHDATLDRTSGTTNFVAAEHTWAEVQQHLVTSKLSINHSQPDQPYVRFDELVAAFGTTHTIFVDPKATDSAHHAELLSLMAKLVPEPTTVFIAKGYCTGLRWAAAANAAGYTTWGFYYGKDLDSNPALLPVTSLGWDVVGLDYEASDANWATMRSVGKPIIGHIIPTKVAEQRVLDQGAVGLMVSAVAEVLA